MPNQTSIPSSRVALVDPKTGLMSQEWYRYFYAVNDITLSDGNTTSLTDLQQTPPVVSWTPPIGMVAFFPEANTPPPGWVEYTPLRGRFPRGMPVGGTPGHTGGTAMTGDTSNTGAPSATINIAAASSSSYVTIVTVDHTHDDTTPFVDGLWCKYTG